MRLVLLHGCPKRAAHVAAHLLQVVACCLDGLRGRDLAWAAAAVDGGSASARCMGRYAQPGLVVSSSAHGTAHMCQVASCVTAALCRRLHATPHPPSLSHLSSAHVGSPAPPRRGACCSHKMPRAGCGRGPSVCLGGGTCVWRCSVLADGRWPRRPPYSRVPAGSLTSCSGRSAASWPVCGPHPQLRT